MFPMKIVKAKIGKDTYLPVRQIRCTKPVHSDFFIWARQRTGGLGPYRRIDWHLELNWL